MCQKFALFNSTIEEGLKQKDKKNKPKKRNLKSNLPLKAKPKMRKLLDQTKFNTKKLIQKNFS